MIARLLVGLLHIPAMMLTVAWFLPGILISGLVWVVTGKYIYAEFALMFPLADLAQSMTKERT